jgi:hypothetical protein
MSDEKSKDDEKKKPASWETKDKDLQESRELSLKERKKQEK